MAGGRWQEQRAGKQKTFSDFVILSFYFLFSISIVVVPQLPQVDSNVPRWGSSMDCFDW